MAETVRGKTRLWLLKRVNDGTKADELVELVIRAGSPSEARKLAAGSAGDESPACWTNQNRSVCIELKQEGTHKVLAVVHQS